MRTTRRKIIAVITTIAAPTVPPAMVAGEMRAFDAVGFVPAVDDAAEFVPAAVGELVEVEENAPVLN
jgi:hypothetical protein